MQTDAPPRLTVLGRIAVEPSRPGSNRKPLAAAVPVSRCIDLGKEFSRRFLVTYEPSYWAQYGQDARVNDPWLKIIVCRAGHIFPWGGSTLAAATDKAGRTARKLAKLRGVTMWADGDDGATVLFDVAEFAHVAKIMQPRRRRRTTPPAVHNL